METEKKRIITYFTEHRKINNKLIQKFENLKTFLENIMKIEGIEKNEILGIFYAFDETTNKLFENLEINNQKLLNITNEMIKTLNEEKKIIKKYFKEKEKYSIEHEEKINNLIITYIRKEQDLLQQIDSITPGIITIADKIIGMEEFYITDLTRKIIKKIDTLINIYEESNKDDKLITFEEIILFLDKYKNYLDEIITHIKTQNLINDKEKEEILKILENYQKNHRKVTTKILEFRIKVGRNQDPQKLYTTSEKFSEIDEEISKIFQKITEKNL